MSLNARLNIRLRWDIIMKEITLEQKRKLYKIVSAIALLVLAVYIDYDGYIGILSYLPAYLLVGYSTIASAIGNIFHGEVFDENFLMSVATIGAFFLGEYPEAVAVMLFYQIGEVFESYAVDKSRKSITSLMDLKSETASILVDNQVIQVSPEDVLVDQLIQVVPGEKIPLDGVIVKGSASLDTRSLTGETLPREVSAGDEVISGSVNLTGVLIIKVSKIYEESTVAKILDLVENATDRKARIENFITRFARYYTPTVVIIALFLGILPPLLIEGALFSQWIYRALTFLVISCPCALVISIPLSFFAGVGASSHAGLLVKGSNFLEAISKAEIIVFDKTGTLTEGVFKVSGIYPENGFTSEALIDMAAAAEYYSNHPISSSILSYYGKEIDKERIIDTKELPGYGISASIDDHLVLVGNKKLMDKEMVANYSDTNGQTAVHIAIDHKYAGCITLSDRIRPGMDKAIKDLKNLGIKKTVLLTGDSEFSANQVKKEVGIDEAFSQLLPTDKVAKVELLMDQKTKKGTLVFIGDGINDAPVLARSDVGVAMGGIGSDAAIEAADVVIIKDEPGMLIPLIKISRNTLNIAKQNVVFALGIKFGVLILGALGIATIWAAVFADVGVTIIAIINAMRALKAPR